MSKTNLIFLDTETTGTDEKDRLCQIAYKAKDLSEDIVVHEVNELFKPPLPISIGAMSVCHITNEMVNEKPAFKGSKVRTDLEYMLKETEWCMVAHNAKFDIGMLEKEGLKVPRHICTMKVARWLDDAGELEKTNLQYLRYYHGIKVDASAHDAMGDVIVLELVFEKLYQLTAQKIKKTDEEDTDLVIEKMIDVSTKPSIVRKMPFGKHKGLLMHLVPGDYVMWLLKQPDLDPDLKYSLQNINK